MNADRKRQSISGADGLTFESKTKKRDRSWDKQHNYQVASYRIDPEIKKYISDLANQLIVSTADIADHFLKYAIKAHKKGDLNISIEPKEYQIKSD